MDLWTWDAEEEGEGNGTGPPGQVLTCPISDCWSNFTRFGFNIRFLTEFHNDSASFLLEKLKKHIILIKNLNI